MTTIAATATEPTSCEVTTDARLSIATGNTTGVYYTLGGAYAEAINQQTGGTLKATAAETSASLQNIQQLVAGTHQIAFSLADTAADAINGTASFDEKQPIAALTRLYPNYTQVIARSDAGINSIADMRGKRVSTGAPNSGTEVIANRMLEAAGLDPANDIQAQRTELGKTVEGIKDGSIDAMFWSGGLPTGGITDLFVSQRDAVKFLDVTDTLPKLAGDQPDLRAGCHPGQHLPDAGRRADRRGAQCASGQSRYGRQHRLRADQGAVRPHGRPDQGQQGRQRHRAGHRPVRPTRFRCIPAPRRRSMSSARSDDRERTRHSPAGPRPETWPRPPMRRKNRRAS